MTSIQKWPSWGQLQNHFKTFQIISNIAIVMPGVLDTWQPKWTAYTLVEPAKWMLRRQTGSPILPCEMSGTGVSRRREMALSE